VPSDLDAILDVQARVDVVRYLMWGPMDRGAAIGLLKRRLKQVAIDGDDSAIILAATVAPDDRPVGEFMLKVSSAAHRQGEIGWLLHPDAQGRGYATEGAREMLRLGFDELRLHRIVADADPRNEASLRVMARLGMRPEAEHRESLYVKGEWVGAAVYAILEDEWRSGGPGLSSRRSRGAAARCGGATAQRGGRSSSGPA
jgi:RimJ/RimL family protein N-acetyltransferase